MSRKLAGVIACMQEIELTLAEIQDRPPFKATKGLEEIRKRVGAFFAQPGRRMAEELNGLLRSQLKESAAYAYLREVVSVDGLDTSLSSLAGELAELLEDLGTE